MEKKFSKHPERFGKGAIEGVAGPESANNSAAQGAFIPLLTLGIPNNAVMALILGALVIHGIQPGPLLMQEHPDIFWGVIASMYIGNAMLLILNLPFIGMWVQVLKIRYNLLFPLILLFCLIGVFSVNNNTFDIWLMIGFGIFGYLARKFKYEMAPLVLALILGPMFENALRQSLIPSLRYDAASRAPTTPRFPVVTARLPDPFLTCRNRYPRADCSAPPCFFCLPTAPHAT